MSCNASVSQFKNADVIRMLRINFYAIKTKVSRFFLQKTQYIVDIIFSDTKKAILEVKSEKVKKSNFKMCRGILISHFWLFAFHFSLFVFHYSPAFAACALS